MHACKSVHLPASWPVPADEAGALSASRREENAALAPLAVATLRALLAFPPDAFRAHLKDFFPLLTGGILGSVGSHGKERPCRASRGCTAGQQAAWLCAGHLVCGACIQLDALLVAPPCCSPHKLRVRASGSAAGAELCVPAAHRADAQLLRPRGSPAAAASACALTWAV